MKKNTPKISDMRKDYQCSSLEHAKMLPNPFEQFDNWFQQALKSEVMEANAMAIATADKFARPSLRMVLLKGFTSEQGFFFYTNYQSRKGKELLENPHASILFYWDVLERQIRIEGKVEKMTEAASNQYFQSRPKKSQIGAIASPQSSILASRKELDDQVEQLEQQYESSESIERPDYWGGFVLIPHTFEFWQGRSNRLHDRFQYRLESTNNKHWKIDRLAP